MKAKKILITGATSFVGKNLVPLMKEKGYSNLVCVSSKDYDLTEQTEVRKMFAEVKPDVVINLAAYVGGILANKNYPGDFFYKNLMMCSLVMHEAKENKIEKFVGLMGGCAYPSDAPSPIKEEDMWNGYPQAESAGYSVAKKTMITQAKSYRKQFGFNAIVLIPGNIYGPYDNYSLENSHVIPALIRKYYEAKRDNKEEIVAWGTGKPTRDFVYIEDVAEAIIIALETYEGEDIINISSGTTISIKELVETIAKVVGYNGKITWDTTKPDGQLYKGFDVSRMKTILGFEPKNDLEMGLKKTIKWFEENYDKPGTVRL
jgi:GDP-L-fucose synthase